MRVHLVIEVSEAHRAQIEGIVAGATFGDPVPAPIDVLVQAVPSEADLEALVPGGAFVLPFAGLPAATRRRLRERPDVAVYNLHHNAPLVAEHAVALLLAASRRLVPLDAAMRRGDWTARYRPDSLPDPGGGRGPGGGLWRHRPADRSDPDGAGPDGPRDPPPGSVRPHRPTPPRSWTRGCPRPGPCSSPCP